MSSRRDKKKESKGSKSREGKHHSNQQSRRETEDEYPEIISSSSTSKGKDIAYDEESEAVTTFSSLSLGTQQAHAHDSGPEVSIFVRFSG